MKAFDSDKIKNITLLGHSGSGKTTLAETMLFEAGMITRRGTVEDGSTVSDYHEIEHERGKTIFGTLMHLQWKDTKINIIDTPGYDDFVGEVIASLRVADIGLISLNAKNGVEVGTEIIWEYVEKFKTPAIIAVNHLDQDKANFEETVEQAKDRFGENVTVVQYPLNQGEGFNAIIDVLKMVMYQFPAEGGKPEKLPIPDSEKEKAEELHNELIEAIAVNDESLMELYFEKGELDESEMAKGLKSSLIHQDIIPVFCTSAKQNMGSGRILGFIRDIAPCSAEMPAAELTNGETLACDTNGDTTLFLYKTVSEQNLGNMSFFKVYAGEVSTGTELVNSQTRGSERINQIYILNGKNRTQVNSLKAGDIGATVKLKNTPTNTTLHQKSSPCEITPIVFPHPRINGAIEANNKGDIEKIVQALYHLQAEDPTLVIENSLELKQVIVNGQGQLHLAKARWLIKNNHKLLFDYTEPKVPFRETIRKSTKAHYRHKKQSGGAGQFGEIYMTIEPYHEGMPKPTEHVTRRAEELIDLDWGGKFSFFNCIVGGAIDSKYMNAIMKGIMEKMADGPLTGSYVRDVRVCVYDGKMHPVDSNDMAFKLAATMAFKAGFKTANPQLLEPIYDVEVLVAADALGDVMGDLQTRRSIIMGIDAAGHYQKIKAKVPLMELYKYASTLRSLTHGRAKHTQKFGEYASLPSDIQQRMIAQHNSALQEA